MGQVELLIAQKILEATIILNGIIFFKPFKLQWDKIYPNSFSQGS